MKSIVNDSKQVVCPRCGKKVVPIKKMFGTKLCPHCSIIIHSESRDMAGK